MFEMSPKNGLSTTLAANVRELLARPIPEDRKTRLQPLIDYLRHCSKKEELSSLVFICTHNSRRSQLAQVWAQTAANLFSVNALAFSGGTELTAFHPSAIRALAETGFMVEVEAKPNPLVRIKQSEESEPILAYSKLFDAPELPKQDFAAIMTCSDADEACPSIHGAKARIPLNYEDPKIYDGSEKEALGYRETSNQIAAEMLWVFSSIR